MINKTNKTNKTDKTDKNPNAIVLSAKSMSALQTLQADALTRTLNTSLPLDVDAPYSNGTMQDSAIGELHPIDLTYDGKTITAFIPLYAFNNKAVVLNESMMNKFFDYGFSKKIADDSLREKNKQARVAFAINDIVPRFERGFWGVKDERKVANAGRTSNAMASTFTLMQFMDALASGNTAQKAMHVTITPVMQDTDLMQSLFDAISGDVLTDASAGVLEVQAAYKKAVAAHVKQEADKAAKESGAAISKLDALFG